MPPIRRIRSVLARLAPPPGTLRFRLLRFARRGWFFALLLAVCWVYTFIASAGLKEWPGYGVYHDLLADGFLKGQLSLPITPDPALVSAKNPYDYSNVNHWWLDATYYRGKYYIYWGPVPALLQAAAKWVLGIHRGIGDHYLAVFFHCLAWWTGALIVERVLRRLFGSHSRALLLLGTLAIAFGHPTPHGVATASTYQTAIIAAQAWLLWGVLVAFDAVWHAGSPNARAWRLPAAATCWGLAVASRVSVLPAVLLLALLTALAVAWPYAARLRRSVTGLVALGVPLAAIGGALLLYNKLRFDAWLEFGSKLQLTAFPLRMSWRYILANLYSYSFRPWATSCEFPYLNQVWHQGRAAFPAWFPLPTGYDVLEPVVGWALAAPITWLIPFAFLLAPGPSKLAQRRGRTYLFCLAAFSVLASVSGAVVLFVYGATMRYLHDVSFGLLLLGILGAYALRFHRFGRASRTIPGALGVLGLATVVAGLLLGYQGYNFHFHSFNPALDRRLVRALSICHVGH